MGCGLCSRKDHAFYFAAADVVVLPYTMASSSGVLLSAYAYKRPVVASAVGGIPELVEDGLSGFLVPPADPRALAEAVCRLLRDPSLAANMGKRGQSMLTKRFDWLRIAGCASVLYQSLWERNTEKGDGKRLEVFPAGKWRTEP